MHNGLIRPPLLPRASSKTSAVFTVSRDCRRGKPAAIALHGVSRQAVFTVSRDCRRGKPAAIALHGVSRQAVDSHGHNALPATSAAQAVQLSSGPGRADTGPHLSDAVATEGQAP